MRLMPDLEEEELALIYEAKGLPAERARETARAMMQDPAQALNAMVREELNIHPAELAPLKDGMVTGTATAVGAFIPIIPFLMMEHGDAVWVSLAVSMLAHFAIGARAQPLHRPRHLGQRPRHVHRRLRRGRRRLPARRSHHPALVGGRRNCRTQNKELRTRNLELRIWTD